MCVQRQQACAVFKPTYWTATTNTHHSPPHRIVHQWGDHHCDGEGRSPAEPRLPQKIPPQGAEEVAAVIATRNSNNPGLQQPIWPGGSRERQLQVRRSQDCLGLGGAKEVEGQEVHRGECAWIKAWIRSCSLMDFTWNKISRMWEEDVHVRWWQRLCDCLHLLTVFDTTRVHEYEH